MLMLVRKLHLTGTALALVLCLGTAAVAETRSVDVPVGDAAISIPVFAQQSGLQIVAAADDLAGKRTNAVKATGDVRQSLQQLLQGTGIVIASDDGRTVTLKRAAAVKASLVAPADPPSAPMEGALGEILVTATKRLEKLHDVANAISAVDQKSLTEQQVDDFDSIAALIPSLSVNDTGAGRVKLVLRGLNASGSSNLVGVLVDDVTLSWSSGLGQGGYTTSNVDTYDMKSVEVLRGPQGTLYGGASEGGLIRFVTNPPKFNKFEGGAELGLKAIDQGGFGYGAKAYVNVPLFEDKAAFRITGLYEGVPGYINDVVEQRQNINKGDKYAVRAQFRVAPVDELDINFTVFKQYNHYGSPGFAENVGEYGGSPTGNVAPGDQFALAHGGQFQDNTYENAPNSNSYEYAALAINYDLGWASLLSSTSYADLYDRNHVDVSYALLAPGAEAGPTLGAILYTGAPNNGAPISIQQDQILEAKKWNEEVRLTSDPGAKLFGFDVDWQVGAYYTSEDITFFQVYNAVDEANGQTLTDPEPGGGSNLPAAYQEYSFFANVDLHLNSALDISLGGRRADIKQYSEVYNFPGFLTGLSTLQVTPAVNTEETTTTWAVAPRWKVSDDTLAYARIATGFRPGGPEFLVPGAPATFPTRYTSDNTTNYEVGVRTSLLDKKLQVSVAAFHIDWNNVQVVGEYVSPSSGITYNVITNVGAAISQGLEWDLEYQVTPGLVAGLEGAYTDARLTADAPGIAAHSGDNLPYVPRLASTFNLDYRREVADGCQVFTGGSIIYTGLRYTDFGNTGYTTHVKLPDYVTLNAHIGVEFGDYSAEIYAQNLTNEHAILGFASQGGYNFLGESNYNQPRTFGARISAKF